ncbi:Bacterial transcriptional activator domain-containing protein OS=Streptomyces fumanus OX=67302 GN=GCM10018772_60810 PE=4 SV=1 [Streptomyces fumanus]
MVDLFAAADPGSGPDGGPGNSPPFLVDISEEGLRLRRTRAWSARTRSSGLTPRTDRGAQLHEALALLLLHREGVHPRVLASALGHAA